MSGTEPLTGARIPTQSDGPLGGLQIANGVSDLAPNTIPFFATASARDTAYSAWVAAGHTMRNGLHCFVSGVGRMMYLSGGWFPLDGYYDEGTGGGTIGTSATTPTDSATLTVPAGTYDVDFSMHFSISVASDRTFVLYLRTGSTDLATPSFPVAVIGSGSAGSFTFNSFRRVTLGASSTLVLRASADTTGGTQNMGLNIIRAKRVA